MTQSKYSLSQNGASSQMTQRTSAAVITPVDQHIKNGLSFVARRCSNIYNRPLITQYRGNGNRCSGVTANKKADLYSEVIF